MPLPSPFRYSPSHALHSFAFMPRDHFTPGHVQHFAMNRSDWLLNAPGLAYPRVSFTPGIK